MVWSKITRVFSLGSQWGDNAVRLVEGDNALAMVKRVEGILEDSMRVLESHEKVMSSGEFNTFSIKHRHLVLKVVEIKHEVQEHQQQSIISASPEGRGYDRIARDVVRLQKQAEVYHRDVMTASHRAQLREEESFVKRHLESSTAEASLGTVLSQLCFQTPLPYSHPALQPHVDREPYLAVAHVRPTKSELDDSDLKDEWYRQILILESKEKTMVMINPNRCYLTEESDLLAESSLLEMSRAGEALLQATDPDHIQGYEVIKTPQRETSLVDSFINTLARLGVGMGADMM
ncbi:hypothetical protein RhiXN_03614 [Rhizoctonia solani]|uniref:Uncharacterized protein n=1 Tax=Rhizoctonia solani TaxID=456999 RepID=A0A8H8ST17_9AGAM|nr:uncharacterized protein RhiXN_03614 [Rhizoctonia solani]QRW15613.1 hypothetical protein RhiXN_03614 [Rhizoctonia solani]